MARPTAKPLMSDFWVFGYGSLMWRPGFQHREAVGAILPGAHRSLCVYSWVHRGTRERPGLVLGLDRGGSCRGVAYRVDGKARDEVVAYLRDRELVNHVYLEAWRSIRLDGPGRRTASALVYLVDRTHEQYAGVLTPAQLLAYVRDSHGRSGANDEYVVNTVKHMHILGIRDRVLEWLADRLAPDAAPVLAPDIAPR